MKKLLLLVNILTVTTFAAVERDICIALDGSGSMGTTNFNIQKNATADQIEDSNIVPIDGTVALSVIQFASNSTVEITRTVIVDTTTAKAVADQVRAITYQGGGTNMTSAVNACVAELDLTDSTSKQIIDLSTDGQPNSLEDTITAVNNAVIAGVDAINALGTGPGVDENQLKQIVRPQPSSQIPDDGFVVIAPDFNSYSAAIKDKMAFEATGVAPAPAPAAVAVPLSLTSKALMSILLLMASLFFIRKENI